MGEGGRYPEEPTTEKRGAAMVVLMGPAGSGKTTVGSRVAAQLGIEFLDADDLHSPADIDAMRRGTPLDHRRRAPWLDRVHAALAAREGTGVVLACSALRESYRRRLGDGLPQLRFVALLARQDVLAARLRARRDHFAGPALLESQIAALELSDDITVVDAGAPIEEVVARVVGLVDDPAGGTPG